MKPSRNPDKKKTKPNPMHSDSDDSLLSQAKPLFATEDITQQEVLNLTLYDQADPANLYMCRFDASKF